LHPLQQARPKFLLRDADDVKAGKLARCLGHALQHCFKVLLGLCRGLQQDRVHLLRVVREQLLGFGDLVSKRKAPRGVVVAHEHRREAFRPGVQDAPQILRSPGPWLVLSDRDRREVFVEASLVSAAVDDR
jgi:hypothetical protein